MSSGDPDAAFAPNPFTGISLMQCYTILGFPARFQQTANETAIAAPMMVVGIHQVICGGLPILIAHRNQWRKPFWLGSLLCCIFCFTTQTASLVLANNFSINWEAGFPIDLRTPFGISEGYPGLPPTQIYTAFLSLAEIAYEIIAALRVGVFLGPRSPKAMAIYAATGLCCVYHLVFCIFIMYYSQMGYEVFAVHAADISKAGVTDLVLTALIDTTTSALFIWQLASRMGLNRAIFLKFFQSRGVLRFVANIGLAIATITQVARPNYQDHPIFGGVFEMWIGWQINTFIQFSFVETKELVQSYSRTLQGTQSLAGPTVMSSTGAPMSTAKSSVASSRVRRRTP
ncbi:hypothetical protein BDZ88DRAFT_220899 [Geranomyces variabilis]|nr:hypothetical protein BDZ88DRAFT_220899 [Geranomyces variabilis]